MLILNLKLFVLFTDINENNANIYVPAANWPGESILHLSDLSPAFYNLYVFRIQRFEKLKSL